MLYNLILVESKTKQNKPVTELIDTERLMVARGRGCGGWAKIVKVVKRYKLPVIR